MNRFILEIGTEEIPSIYIDKTLNDLKDNMMKELQQLRIEYHLVQAYGTPRRLIVYIDDISVEQKDTLQKIKGPSKAIAFDKDGNPSISAIKFAQANQLTLKDLVTEYTDKGEYLFVQKRIKGKKTESLLPEICLKIISNITFPKSMRWGKTSFRFIRPIRWLLALYNDNMIPFTLATIHSGCTTFGHRLLSPNSATVISVGDYFKIIRNCFVIIDPVERKKMIFEQMIQLIRQYHGKELIDESLLEEVKNLVEYPKVLLGHFHKNYLKLPSEVLKAVMIRHQKYFPIYSEDGQLLPHFLVVINGNKERYKDTIIQGNERVLKARLEDARFFYQEDQKVSDKKVKPLDKNVEKLKQVTYQENLGSIYDKVERLVALTKKMGEMLQIDTHVSKILRRSAQLCKSDLVTEMVKEFPELQGIMGKEYALLQGEDHQVAETIYEQYLPRFSGDNLPKTLSGSILSIVDKLDHIISCFSNDIIPDGSQDPYALRRQSLGILNITVLNKMDFSLDQLIDFNIKLMSGNNHYQNQHKTGTEETINQKIKYFILQRFRYLLLEKNYEYDIVDAVLSKNPESMMDILSRIMVIQRIYHLPKFNKIITAATRTSNLSKNFRKMKINSSIFQEKEEHVLYDCYLAAKQKIEKAIIHKQYEEVFEQLALISAPIDQYFDHVLVMDKNEKIRNNRLALLQEITGLYYSAADLSKIALAKGNVK